MNAHLVGGREHSPARWSDPQDDPQIDDRPPSGGRETVREVAHRLRRDGSTDDMIALDLEARGFRNSDGNTYTADDIHAWFTCAWCGCPREDCNAGRTLCAEADRSDR